MANELSHAQPGTAMRRRTQIVSEFVALINCRTESFAERFFVSSSKCFGFFSARCLEESASNWLRSAYKMIQKLRRSDLTAFELNDPLTCMCPVTEIRDR